MKSSVAIKLLLLAAVALLAQPAEAKAALRGPSDVPPSALSSPERLEGPTANKASFLEENAGNKSHGGLLPQDDGEHGTRGLLEGSPGNKPHGDGEENGDHTSRRLHRWCNRWPFYCNEQ